MLCQWVCTASKAPAHFQNESDFLNQFQHHYASHLTGMLKPDLEAYRHIISDLGVTAGNILFLDDNKINIDAAIKCGMQGRVVRSLVGVKAELTHQGLL